MAIGPLKPPVVPRPVTPAAKAEVVAPPAKPLDVDALAPATEVKKAVVAVGPVPAIDALLKSKPNARIALVQGSFDWIHNGHLDLLSAVAASKMAKTDEPFDLVVVMPTTSNKQKAFLADGVAQRLKLVESAVAGRDELRGRVTVSDAALKGDSPEGLMHQLLERYGSARFTFVQGADAFNQSAKWPTFRIVEDNMALAVVPRAGVPLQQGERVDQLIDCQPTAVSSSEIRRALEAGDLSPIESRVPPTTLEALRRELKRREDPATQTLQWFAA